MLTSAFLTTRSLLLFSNNQQTQTSLQTWTWEHLSNNSVALALTLDNSLHKASSKPLGLVSRASLSSPNNSSQASPNNSLASPLKPSLNSSSRQAVTLEHSHNNLEANSNKFRSSSRCGEVPLLKPMFGQREATCLISQTLRLEISKDLRHQ